MGKIIFYYPENIARQKEKDVFWETQNAQYPQLETQPVKCGLSQIHVIVSLTDSMQAWSPEIHHRKASCSTIKECKLKF